MDPVTHTLAGAALGRARLVRPTRLAVATAVIGANLPDVDVASYAWGADIPLWFRRGWTHGILAVVVFPLLLTAGVLLWDRVLRRRRPDAPPVDARAIAVLAGLSVLSHPLLDLLNVYGIRLLMPFSERWFYGDVLFIIDPVLWVLLAAGVVLAGRGAAARPARVALVAAGAYILLMTVSAQTARWMVWRSMPFARAAAERVMVGPEPLSPFRKWVVIDEGERYRVGDFDWLRRPRVRYSDLVPLPVDVGHPVADAARARAAVRPFLYWARFPFVRVDELADRTRVHFIDARYALEPDARFGAVTVEVPDD